MTANFGLILLGLLAGVLSGLVGIGGGVVIVPTLIFLYGYTQQMAQGTTLAVLIPPIGILAAYTYYQKGFVNITAAALICAGFVLGGFIGAKIATNLSNATLQKIFGVAVILIGLRMLEMKR